MQNKWIMESKFSGEILTFISENTIIKNNNGLLINRFYNCPLKNVKNKKKYLIMSRKTISMRRKKLSEYIYFNIFRNYYDFQLFLDTFFEWNEDISYININIHDNFRFISLMDTNENNILNMRYNKFCYSEKYSIINTILTYYNK